MPPPGEEKQCAAGGAMRSPTGDVVARLAKRPPMRGLRPGGRYAEWFPTVPYYLAADVDGTIVGESPSATATVARSSRRVVEAGVRAGFATARLAGAITALERQTSFRGPHLIHNGAAVVHNGFDVAAWPMRRKAAELLVGYCLRHGLYVEAYLVDECYVSDRRPAAASHWRALRLPMPRLLAEADLGSSNVLRVSIAVLDDETPTTALRIPRMLGLSARVATVPAADDMVFVDCTAADTDKGRALAFTTDYLGCTMSAVVAIGDGYNDIPMLSVAGTSIAMGDAPPEVREAAHLVGPDAAHDGAAIAFDYVARWRAGALGPLEGGLSCPL